MTTPATRGGRIRVEADCKTAQERVRRVVALGHRWETRQLGSATLAWNS
jgi:hypothetical protein